MCVIDHVFILHAFRWDPNVPASIVRVARRPAEIETVPLDVSRELNAFALTSLTDTKEVVA